MKDPDDFDPLSDALSPEHLQAIGYLTASASVLEAVMDEAISCLLGVSNPVGNAVTAQLTFTTRLNLLRTLADEILTDPTFKDQLDPIVRKIEMAQKKRNEIVHANWQDTKEPGTAIAKRTVAREKIVSKFNQFTVVELKERAEFIDFVMRDLNLWTLNQQINKSLSFK